MKITSLLMDSLLHRNFFFFFSVLLFIQYNSSALPLCTNSRAPISLKTPLNFCSYNGRSCCNATEDDDLQKNFNSMNISDSDCASVVKSILCTKCDPYSSDLFTTKTKPRKIPILCKNTINDPSTNFCNKIWNTCKDINIQNSPFSSSESNSPKIPSSKLTNQWNSSTEFCKEMESSIPAESICFNGTSISFKNTEISSPPQGICIEKIGNGSFLNMEPHPDGSNRVFLSNQAGLIWLTSVPVQESGGTLDLNQDEIFIDLTDIVYSDTQFGVMGLVFHPNFAENGRFFVSFNCDKVQMASCSGRCACNSEVGCDPSKLGLDDGDQHCRYQSVVSEFTVNGSSSTPSKSTSGFPSEVRRIFTIGLPYNSHHAGQIIFGPEDGYLYFMMGDGGNKGDPFNFAQNKKSVLGKIMRLDVNQIPSSKEIIDLDLWGNYTIPKDNPFNTDDNELLPEIWALGLRNPWRCSFDSKKPSYFFCADVGEDTYEEINLISKGGNYGWRVYEGSSVFHPSWTPGGNTSTNSINQILPIMGYNHSSVNNVGSASITGGYVYRSNTDPCLNGRFVYADLYGRSMWAGIENPQNSGIYNTTKLSFSCAADSPIPCETIEDNTLPSLGILYSFAQDNADELYILASKGVFRIVRPSRCNYVCASESHTDTAIPPPDASSSSAECVMIWLQLVILILNCFFVLYCSF